MKTCRQMLQFLHEIHEYLHCSIWSCILINYFLVLCGNKISFLNKDLLIWKKSDRGRERERSCLYFPTSCSYYCCARRKVGARQCTLYSHMSASSLNPYAAFGCLLVLFCLRCISLGTRLEAAVETWTAPLMCDTNIHLTHSAINLAAQLKFQDKNALVCLWL